MKYQIGQKVNHLLLGDGVIKGMIEDVSMYSVLFEYEPPFEYNMGQNPCLIHENDLKEK